MKPRPTKEEVAEAIARLKESFPEEKHEGHWESRVFEDEVAAIHTLIALADYYEN
jgi:hypothetical protein